MVIFFLMAGGGQDRCSSSTAYLDIVDKNDHNEALFHGNEALFSWLEEDKIGVVCWSWLGKKNDHPLSDRILLFVPAWRVIFIHRSHKG
jgi:hypothetical protein